MKLSGIVYCYLHACIASDKAAAIVEMQHCWDLGVSTTCFVSDTICVDLSRLCTAGLLTEKCKSRKRLEMLDLKAFSQIVRSTVSAQKEELQQLEDHFSDMAIHDLIPSLALACAIQAFWEQCGGADSGETLKACRRCTF